jgi:hypothetical protein
LEWGPSALGTKKKCKVTLGLFCVSTIQLTSESSRTTEQPPTLQMKSLTEAQRGDGTCPMSQASKWQGQTSSPGQLSIFCSVAPLPGVGGSFQILWHWSSQLHLETAFSLNPTWASPPVQLEPGVSVVTLGNVPTQICLIPVVALND